MAKCRMPLGIVQAERQALSAGNDFMSNHHLGRSDLGEILAYHWRV